MKGKQAVRAGQPSWRLVANLGDANPLEHGGYFVYQDTTGRYAPQAEVLMLNGDGDDYAEGDPLYGDDEAIGSTYTVWRFDLDWLRLVDGFLVPEAYDHLTWDAHPLESYAEWFDEDLAAVASCMGCDVDDLHRMFCSEDVLERAEAYRMVGDHHGWDNLDQYPVTLTREDAEERYPDFA